MHVLAITSSATPANLIVHVRHGSCEVIFGKVFFKLSIILNLKIICNLNLMKTLN